VLVLEDLFDDRSFVDEADDLHLGAAFWAFQRIDFPDLLDAFAPGLRRDLLRLVFADIQDFDCFSYSR